MNKEKHAEVQRKYVERKQKQATRKCVWVPKGHEEEFNNTLKKLKEKWPSKNN
jgi:hypothetical protein